LHQQLHPMTPHHLPSYLAKPGETDVLMIVMGIFLIAAVLGVGNIYLRLHSLPERMAHKSQKMQFEVVAILCLDCSALAGGDRPPGLCYAAAQHRRFGREDRRGGEWAGQG
jgi:hypothetical protein